MVAGRINPFHLLLLALLFIPNLLGYTILGNPLLVGAINVILFVAYILHVKGFKLNYPPFFNVAVIILLILYLVWNFSIENLPQKLYVIANTLIVLQLLSGQQFRTYLYITLLSFLNLTLISVGFSNLFYGLIIFSYLFLLIYFLLLLAVKAFQKGNSKIYKHLLVYSILIYAAIAAGGFVLFFVLPRPSQPIFALIKRQSNTPVVAFSSGVRLGSFSQIAESNQVVFRARLKNFNTKENLYWRGNTLEIYHHGMWLPTYARYVKEANYAIPPFIQQEIILMPYGDKFVFTLGYPVHLVSGPRVIFDWNKGIVLLRRTYADPVGLTLITSQHSSVELSNRKILLEVPDDVKPTVEKFIKENNIPRTKDLNKVIAVLGKVFSHFGYSLTNKAQNLEQFLFKYKEGNCEYFASAGALILRELGFPTRLVVGFLGGEYNPITRFYIVRQKDAHAWVEVYYNNTWVRFDPTSFARVEGGITQKVEDLAKNKLALFWDTLNTLWLQYVINLNAHKQKELFKKLKKSFSHLPKEKLIRWALIVVVAAIPIFLWIYRAKIALFFYKLYLRRKYGLKLAGKSFVEIYSLLWKRNPKVLEREREKLLKFIRLFPSA